MELADFLRMRLAEDEAGARVLLDDRRPGRAERWEFCDDGAIRDTGAHRSLRVKFTWSPEAAHIARHDPARVLAEVEAKRFLVAGCESALAVIAEDPDDPAAGKALGPIEHTLRYFARPFRDHPDFDPAWLED